MMRLRHTETARHAARSGALTRAIIVAIAVVSIIALPGAVPVRSASVGIADELLAKGEADAVSFGKDFIANPDLPLRLYKRVPLNPQRMESFYGYGLSDHSVGYTDYPRL